MKRRVQWLLAPMVVLLGMAFLGTPDADAGWRRRYYRHYYAPPVVYAPAPPVVRVYTPGVHVASPYYYGPPAVVVPPRVVAPPRIITPWFQMW